MVEFSGSHIARVFSHAQTLTVTFDIILQHRNVKTMYIYISTYVEEYVLPSFSRSYFNTHSPCILRYWTWKTMYIFLIFILSAMSSPFWFSFIAPVTEEIGSVLRTLVHLPVRWSALFTTAHLTISDMTSREKHVTMILSGYVFYQVIFKAVLLIIWNSVWWRNRCVLLSSRVSVVSLFSFTVTPLRLFKAQYKTQYAVIWLYLQPNVENLADPRTNLLISALHDKCAEGGLGLCVKSLRILVRGLTIFLGQVCIIYCISFTALCVYRCLLPYVICV